jgi:SdrD B-like domain
MNTGASSSRSGRVRGFTHCKLAPMIEVVEKRQLLDGGIGTIAGTVFFDSNGDNQIDAADAYLPGATVQLYKAGSATPLATAVSDASGGYAFHGLAAGTYTITEVATTNQAVSGNRIRSDLVKATSVDASTIEVTLTDSTKVVVNYGGVVGTQYLALNKVVNGHASQGAVGALGISIGSAAGATDLALSFSADCLDDLHQLSFAGGESFQVTPRSITELTNGTSTISADHAGRIAYLFNHYGSASLTNIQAAGLQLAIWELIYDNRPTADFGSGNFQSTGPILPSEQGLFDQATSLFNESAGKCEAGVFLSASSTLGTPPPGGDGYQSMVVRGSFDFLNRASGTGGTHTPEAAISGYVYDDASNDGVKQASEAAIAGVTVTLTGANDLGQSISLVAQTDASGFYQFPNLRPGTYSLVETQPAGYLDGKDTPGTPGNGVAGNDRFTSITLVDGDNGRNNNFGEIKAAPAVTALKLYGIHMRPTQIVLDFNGQLDPTRANDPASYKIIALGKDQTLATADDSTIAITSAVYDNAAGTVTLTPAVHLNIHYHYLLSASVAAASPGSSGLSYTTVFGRAALPTLDQSGKAYPVSRMTTCQLKRDQMVVQKALGVWAKYDGNLPNSKVPTSLHRRSGC